MKKKKDDFLEGELSKLKAELSLTSTSDPEYYKVCNQMIKIQTVIDDQKKMKLSEKQQNARNSIDQKRLELEELKLVEETKINNAKLNFEIKKLEDDIKNRDCDAKEKKRNLIFNTCLKVFEVSLPLIINGLLTIRILNLIYFDDGRVTPELRDALKNVYKPR